MPTSLEIKHAHYSIAGIKAQNEDSCGVVIPDEPLLKTKGIAVVIADGMSASDDGKLASESCVKSFLSDYFSTPETWSVKSSGQKILAASNRWLHGQGQRKYQSHQGMVTTLSALVFKSNTAYIFHVGDTRIYRLRNNDLEQLTNDHRFTVSKEKSYLSRALGIDLHVDIDYKKLAVETGDIYIQLTDGVYDFITDQKIKDLVSDNKASLETASQAIVEMAVNNKSDDNLTCQLVKVTRLPKENENEFYDKLTELPFPPTLEPGLILDGYKVIRHLFSNKRTEVYLVQDTETNENIVMKAPSVNYQDDPEYINQFLHEEWAGRRINNPHVLKILETTRKRTALYYITEYIEGCSLRQWLDDNPRPSLNQVRTFSKQIERGLRAFHRLEMIHQDLKPENILIDKNETLKIIDFGSAKIAGIEEIYLPIEVNNILGTIDYTAPEYHIGDSGSNRSDIYSLGVIVYEMLTGHLPYGKDMTARNIKRARYISLKRYNPEIPVWVDKAIEKAVHINPENRFSILSEFTYALNKPDSSLVNSDYVPLIKRDPVRSWQIISFILLLINIILIYKLNI
ncbi:MAG: protein kinase [Gammaproteobacteria bacterium]|nr:protein kinase [Gammaproteobacteria bacterium]MCW8988602.1 protein kinase [Gammaproteobacteria bacterium]MCW9032436.1 protein kinase [Gammaproteobacteria bacterium]